VARETGEMQGPSEVKFLSSPWRMSKGKKKKWPIASFVTKIKRRKKKGHKKNMMPVRKATKKKKPSSSRC